MTQMRSATAAADVKPTIKKIKCLEVERGKWQERFSLLQAGRHHQTQMPESGTRIR